MIDALWMLLLAGAFTFSAFELAHAPMRDPALERTYLILRVFTSVAALILLAYAVNMFFDALGVL